MVRAYKGRVPGELYWSRTQAELATFNRSIQGYNANPPEELAQYKEATDREMTQVKLVSKEGREIGLINWFPIHPVSLPITNKLISGDNKGLASYYMEKSKGVTNRKCIDVQ